MFVKENQDRKKKKKKKEFTFSKLVKIIVFRCLPANKTVGYAEVANYSEAIDKVNKPFVKENEKKKSESVKTLEIYGWIFPNYIRLITFYLLKVASYI